MAAESERASLEETCLTRSSISWTNHPKGDGVWFAVHCADVDQVLQELAA